MVATLANVKSRIGDIYNDLPSTKDTDIADFILDSTAWVDEYTGTTSGILHDSAATNLAAIYTLIEAGGGQAVGFDYSIGKMQVDRPVSKYTELIAKLELNLKEEIKALGKKVRYAKVNG